MELNRKRKKAMNIDNQTVAKMAKEKQVFTFQAAADYFGCGTAYGLATREKRHLLQIALFAMIDKNQLTYNPQTGYYKYIGA